jgi:hypothetical protein
MLMFKGPLAGTPWIVPLSLVGGTTLGVGFGTLARIQLWLSMLVSFLISLAVLLGFFVVAYFFFDILRMISHIA